MNHVDWFFPTSRRFEQGIHRARERASPKWDDDSPVSVALRRASEVVSLWRGTCMVTKLGRGERAREWPLMVTTINLSWKGYIKG